MNGRRIWIIDGHNVIFAVPPLRRLQVSDRREEARRTLAEAMERFALARGERVLIVFDGNPVATNPDSIPRTLIETVYARGGEGAADDRVIREATALMERRQPVAVVTNDVSTLARRLPRGVHRMAVESFWLKYIEKKPSEGDKPTGGDFSDVEREMLARAAEAEAPPRDICFGPRRDGSASARPSDGPRWGGSKNHSVPEDPTRDRIHRKRERGRLRQERRLRRRRGPGRGG